MPSVVKFDDVKVKIVIVTLFPAILQLTDPNPKTAEQVALELTVT